MSEDECRAFVVKAISHAMARDCSSGGVIRTVTITKEGVKKGFMPNTRLPTAFGELPAPSAAAAAQVQA